MPGPEASRAPMMFMMCAGKLRQARPEASQGQMMLMMRSWWRLQPGPEAFSSKTPDLIHKPNTVQDPEADVGSVLDSLLFKLRQRKILSRPFPRKCFEFSHPNWQLTNNDRRWVLVFHGSFVPYVGLLANKMGEH